MAEFDSTIIKQVLQKNESEILAEWVNLQERDLSVRNNLLKKGELEQQSREFLTVLLSAMQSGARGDAGTGGPWSAVQDYMTTIARSRAKQGFSPRETATFLFSLKQPVFNALRKEMVSEPEVLADAVWNVTTMLDQLGLFVTEVYQKGREEIIARQQQELMELSTPVVQLWDGILALPLIGTLDSARTQVVMESLLQAIVDTGSSIAIIDITGVPVVDTLVAQHLLKTVAAARLMGADCIISGIRPQIAQTIVHLGVEINDVVTKATLSAAFGLALKRLGLGVARVSGTRLPPAGSDAR